MAAPSFPGMPVQSQPGSPVLPSHRAASPIETTQRSTLEGTTLRGVISGTFPGRFSGGISQRQALELVQEGIGAIDGTQPGPEHPLELSRENVEKWKASSDYLETRDIDEILRGRAVLSPRHPPTAQGARSLKSNAPYAGHRIRARTRGAASAITDLGLSQIWTIALTRQATEIDDLGLQDLELDPIQQEAQSERFAKALVMAIFVLVLTSTSTAIAITILVQDSHTVGISGGHIIWLVVSAATIPILVGAIWVIINRRQKVIRQLQVTMVENMRRVVIDRERLYGRMSVIDGVRRRHDQMIRDNANTPMRRPEDWGWEDHKAQFAFLARQKARDIEKWLGGLKNEGDWEDVRGDSQFGGESYTEFGGRLDLLNAARAREYAVYSPELTEFFAQRESDVGSLHRFLRPLPPPDGQGRNQNRQAETGVIP